MSRRRLARVATLAVGLTLALGWLVCCTSSQPHGAPAISTPDAPSAQPVDEPDRPTPAPAAKPPAAEHDGTAQPAPGPAQITPPTPPPTEPPQELPDYLGVTARFDQSKPAFVDFEVTSPNRLAIETRNVRRLWIDRAALPLRTDRSIVLQLDGQGIEWTPTSTTTVFERSPNGAWMPAKEDRP